tara:strand:- start:404 stop:514 length:111 start_codon:yes stop_codon:yes gene_type:complete
MAIKQILIVYKSKSKKRKGIHSKNLNKKAKLEEVNE